MSLGRDEDEADVLVAGTFQLARHGRNVQIRKCLLRCMNPVMGTLRPASQCSTSAELAEADAGRCRGACLILEPYNYQLFGTCPRPRLRVRKLRRECYGDMVRWTAKQRQTAVRSFSGSRNYHNSPETRARTCVRAAQALLDQWASGSGRSWICTARGFEPLPVSCSQGARSPLVLQSPRPFQPAFGSSMRPSKPLA
jgi:hypothetical protein